MNISISSMWNEGTSVLKDILIKSRTVVLILLGCLFVLLVIKIVVDLGK